jgi:predicted glutamine amidotransferase
MDTINKNTIAVVGHCRQSTQGVASDNKNNHPHYCRKTISVHNGHISGWKKFAEQWRLKLNSNCDSELFPFAYNFFRTELKWSKTRALKYFCEEVKPTGVFVFYSNLDPDQLSILKLTDRLGTIKPILKNGEKTYIFNTVKNNIDKAIDETPVFQDFLVTKNPEEESMSVNSLIEFAAKTTGSVSVYHQLLKTVK